MSQFTPGINVFTLVILLCILCVGDIVQLGSSSVFRFNHPREAAEMKDFPNEASYLLQTCTCVRDVHI